MVTTKQKINPLVLVQISVEILVQFQKIPIADIEKFAVSAADILPIRYISTPLSNITSWYKFVCHDISVAPQPL